MAAIERAQADGSRSTYDVDALVVPEGLATASDENGAAMEHFESFSDSSQKGILWWIASAKREAMWRKRGAGMVRLAAMAVRVNYPEAQGR